MALTTRSAFTKLNVRKCCFIGLPASGKSYCAEKWSQWTKIQHISIDNRIEKHCGASIKDIFEQKGEEIFRKKESIVLKTALKEKAFILDPGAGIVENANNRELIKNNCFIVYLYCPLRTLQDRLSNEVEMDKRPLLHSVTISELEKIFMRRSTLYDQMADVTLHTDFVESYLPLLAEWWKNIIN